ncbi:MAG: recombinase family protein, partial [Proteobacteria bacterium]|nr:recombinase family protein [Pseudomonadota bacterium]
ELGELDYYLRTFFAAQERRKIAQRTQAGRKRIAADGGYTGAGFVPYGLDWDRNRREWSIDCYRAAIVRDVYGRCLDGQGAGTIANELNARGVSTQQGKHWHQSTVVKMLRMPAYAWIDQLKEIAADRRVLERSRDAAREQLAMAQATDYSIDLVEAQLDELQDRVRAAAPEDRKAIIETVIPGEQPFGIVLWPDGKIDIRGAIPVPPESEVAKPNTLPGQAMSDSSRALPIAFLNTPAAAVVANSAPFDFFAAPLNLPSPALHPLVTCSSTGSLDFSAALLNPLALAYTPVAALFDALPSLH